MKDKTSKQCSFKELHCSYKFVCTSLFLLYLVFRVWIWFGICCIFVLMRMKAEAPRSQGCQQSFVSRSTEDIRCITSYSNRCIMLTSIVDLTKCLTSALMSNMQSICQISICRFETNTQRNQRENTAADSVIRLELDIKVCNAII